MKREIVSLLRGSAVVSSVCGSRVNFGAHPQGLGYPAIVLNVVSDVEGVTLSGSTGLAASRLQVDCYAFSPGEAHDLSSAVRGLLAGHSGGAIQGVFYDNSRDGRDQDAEGRSLFRVSPDFMVHFSRE